MLELYDLLLERLEQELETIQVTVTLTEGSTPARAGGVMLADAGGALGGTVGGGALEYRALQTAAILLRQKHGGVQKYDLVDGSGGHARVELLYTYWNPCLAAQGVCGIICTAGREHKTMHIALPLNGTLPLGEPGLPCYDLVIQSLPRAVVFGAGHVAAELVPLLAHLGWRCLVIDERPELATAERFAQAEEIWTLPAAEALDKLRIGVQDYLCIMTPSHETDREILERVIDSRAHYIGMLGSRAKKQQLFEDLTAAGVSPEQLDRVALPIGLYIYGHTPAEIALSIAAQMIREKNSGGKDAEEAAEQDAFEQAAAQEPASEASEGSVTENVPPAQAVP